MRYQFPERNELAEPIAKIWNGMTYRSRLDLYLHVKEDGWELLEHRPESMDAVWASITMYAEEEPRDIAYVLILRTRTAANSREK